MIVNADKFQVNFLDEGKSDDTSKKVEIGNNKVKNQPCSKASPSSY